MCTLAILITAAYIPCMLMNLINLLSGEAPAEPEDKDHAARVAIAAILAEAAMADGVYAIEEQQKIGRILAFNLVTHPKICLIT